MNSCIFSSREKSLKQHLSCTGISVLQKMGEHLKTKATGRNWSKHQHYYILWSSISGSTLSHRSCPRAEVVPMQEADHISRQKTCRSVLYFHWTDRPLSPLISTRGTRLWHKHWHVILGPGSFSLPGTTFAHVSHHSTKKHPTTTQETPPNEALLTQPFSSGEEEFSYRLQGCKPSCDIQCDIPPRSQRALSRSFPLTAWAQPKAEITDCGKAALWGFGPGNTGQSWQ